MCVCGCDGGACTYHPQLCGHPLLEVGMPMAAVLLVCLILLFPISLFLYIMHSSVHCHVLVLLQCISWAKALVNAWAPVVCGY